MFRKPPSNVKSYSPLRSSDRRRFKEEILKKFPPLESSLITLIESSTDATETKAESPLNLIAPENIQVAKFTSNLGIHGAIYMTKNKQPIWFKTDKDKNEILVPSVYTLWNFPDMLPKIPTFDIVVAKLTGGANFMIPGIAFPPEGLPDVNEGELVSIVIKDSSMPMAVGTMNISTKLLEPGSTRKGIAVNIIHVFGDNLWSMGDQSKPPELTDVKVEAEASRSKNVDATEELDEDDVVEGGSLEKEFESKLTISEVDKILIDSFYQALSEKLTPATPLPMTTSQFYSAYILPCRPVGTENEVDIKKSSYKKVTKFLNAMEKKGIIKIKETREGTTLTHVDWKHDSLSCFRPHKTIGKAAASATISEPNEESTSIQIKEVFKPKGGVVDLFKAQGQNVEKDTIYEFEEIRSIVLNYLESHDLSDKKNKKFVIPDEQIREALANNSGERISDKWTRNDLIKEIQSRMEPCHYVIFPDRDSELRKGIPKSIQLAESTRSGNKTVTTIRGLENYRIMPNDLVEPLQRLCACSVAVNPTPQSSPKKPLMEVMVQGPQIVLIKEYLVNTKGFPGKYIEATKAKKKGKK